MKKLSKIIKEKLSRLDSVPDEFENGVVKSQKKIFDQIIDLVSSLEKEGSVIKSSKANLSKASIIVNKLKVILNKSEYKKVVKSFLKEFDSQAVINNKYFSEEFGSFKPTKFSLSVIDSQKKDIATSLIGATSIDRELQKPLRDILFKSISEGATNVDLIHELRESFLGSDERLGKLHRYSKQIAKDAFSQTDRLYTKINAESIKSEFYLYQGGLVKDSREFCKSREAKYYHFKEIREWGDISSWQGRISGTTPSNIFTNLGGHNCNHAVLPVSVFSVPKDILIRNLENGNFKPNKKQKDLLGI